MSWNKPQTSTNKAPINNRTRGRNLILVGGLFGCVLIASIVVTCCIVFSRTDNSQPESLRITKRLIREKVPAAPQAPAERDYTTLSAWDLRHLEADETNKLNAAQVAYWKMFHPWPPPDENQIERIKPRYEIFENRVDNEIACLVSVEPGTQVFGNRNYGPNFTKRFLKSLEKPIIATHEDTEYEKSVKRAVNEAKIELKAAYDRGEDIVEVMNETRKELQRLGRYREELVQMARKEARRAEQPDDVKDIVTAVNKMLDQKGLAPIRPNSISRLALQMQMETTEKE